MNTVLELIGAISGLGALGVTAYRAIGDTKRTRSITTLETGKLDLGLAGLGLQAMAEALEEVRQQVKECHHREDALKEQLRDHGLSIK